ncbi:LamG domain-containing protein [Candidatus Poribacteria bacterium]|nr:LamG domain-containing protein [Candidatus Poribacteria bacterium]
MNCEKAIRLLCTLSFLLVALWTVNVAEAGPEFITDGLVAMYTLDQADTKGDVVKDTFGKNDAKLMGKLKFVKGQIGEALEFDGGPNYVEIPKLGPMELASVEAWALEKQFGAIQGIVSTWQWVAGKVHFKFENNEIQAHKNDGVKIRLAAKAGEWYHIIYTCDTKKNELKLYVNGALVDQGVAGPTPQNMDERRIGSEHDGRFLTGMVDEVRIYNRILDEKEVKQNFGAKTNKLAVDPAGKLATAWGTMKSQSR